MENCLLTNSWWMSWMSEHDVAVSKCMNLMPTKCSKRLDVHDLCYCYCAAASFLVEAQLCFRVIVL